MPAGRTNDPDADPFTAGSPHHTASPPPRSSLDMIPASTARRLETSPSRGTNRSGMGEHVAGAAIPQEAGHVVNRHLAGRGGQVPDESGVPVDGTSQRGELLLKFSRREFASVSPEFWREKLAWPRIVDVPRKDVRVQMRNPVAKNLVVEVTGSVNGCHRPRRCPHSSAVRKGLAIGEIAGISDVAPAEHDHDVTGLGRSPDQIGVRSAGRREPDAPSVIVGPTLLTLRTTSAGAA